MDFLFKVMLWFVFWFSAWFLGLILFIGQIPTTVSTDNAKTDAIVVFADDGSSRIGYGLQMLSDGLAKKLFVSGVRDNINVDDFIIHNADPLVRAKLVQNEYTTVILGREASSIAGSAKETKEWLDLEHYQSLRIVTSNYLMPRTVHEFKKALKDVTIIQCPVMPAEFTMNNWWLVAKANNVIISEYHKYLLSRVRLFFLWLMHPRSA